MRKLVCPRLPQFQACVSPLGQLHTRPLFGGYSLAIDDTVFAMVAEGNIYLKACEQSAAYRVEHRQSSVNAAPTRPHSAAEVLSN